MFELLDLKEWKKKKDILKELKNNGVRMSERAWRKSVELHNKRYFEHQTDKFLAHSVKGYKLTDNKDEIINSAKDYRKRAMDLLVKYSKTLKAMGENDNVRFEIKNGSFIMAEF